MSNKDPLEVKCCHGVVSVKPGDKLVIAGDFDTDDIGHWSNMIAEHLPGVHIVCISGVSQMVVSTPDAGPWPDRDMLEAAWGIIANVGNGDWDQQRPDWQEAARKWADAYHRKSRGHHEDNVPPAHGRDGTLAT